MRVFFGRSEMARSWRVPFSRLLHLAIVCSLLVQVSLFTPVAALRGDEAIPSSKSIVDKAIAFHGGAKALGRDLALVRTEESDLILEGDKVVMKSEWQFQPPDKRVSSYPQDRGLQLHIRLGLVGDKGWVKVGPALAVDLSPEQAAGLSWEHDNHVQNVRLLATVDRDFDVSAPKSIRIGAHDVWQINITGKKKNTTAVFFDKTSGAVLGSEAERVVPTLGADHTREKLAKFRVLFKDYHDVNGIKMPDALSIARDGALVVEVRKAETHVVDAVDPKYFAKPK